MKAQLLDVINCLKGFRDGCYLSVLVRELCSLHHDDYSRLYHRVRRMTLNRTDLFNSCKRDGLILISCTATALDLLNANAKFKLAKPHASEFPAKMSSLRRDAVQTVASVKMLSELKREHLDANFSLYLEDIEDKEIVLKKKYESSDEDDIVMMQYKTRFNDEMRRDEQVQKYDAAWERATQRYKVAVELMLTTDPSRFKSLWEANRHMSRAWNKFLSYLQKRFGFRPQYVCAFEFTKRTGLLHLHAVIFGIGWINKKDEITREWERCGQGSYTWIFKIVNDSGEWHWLRQKPRDARDMQPRDYLKKYLKKSLYDQSSNTLYWTFNKRFFTHSRDLITHIKIIKSHDAVYVFIGCWHLWDMPSWLENPREFVISDDELWGK
jgi:hypothetical protein